MSDVVLIDQDAQILASTRLAAKRTSRNAYMKKYRSHLRLLPTYAVLMKFQGSAIKFNTASGVQCSASIKDDALYINVPHDCTNICILPTDIREAKKIVAATILAAWKLKKYIYPNIF